MCEVHKSSEELAANTRQHIDEVKRQIDVMCDEHTTLINQRNILNEKLRECLNKLSDCGQKIGKARERLSGLHDDLIELSKR